MDPPANVRPLIEQQITAIDGHRRPRPRVTAAQPPAGAANPGAEVRVNVTLAPSLAAAVGAFTLLCSLRDPRATPVRRWR